MSRRDRHSVGVVKRTLRMAPPVHGALEGKGTVAEWDSRLDQLVLTTATSSPHIVRNVCGMPRHSHERIRVDRARRRRRLRWKGLLQPRNCASPGFALSSAARCAGPRSREHLVPPQNAREPHYELTAYSDKPGQLLALDRVNIGHPVRTRPKSVPRPASRPRRSARSCPPLDFPAFRYRTWSVSPTTADRALSRRRARRRVFAMESMWMRSRQRPGSSPMRCGLAPWCPASAMPFTNIIHRKHVDSGGLSDLLASARRCPRIPASVRQHKTREPDDG